ncbi:sensor histidine kinase [Microbacterium sp. CJ88]|uniref:sensor histidine kinase n=1 Tax=Microbacterium sp. CJ88 TaxID=3445672 RepID=UPI003F657399
MNRRSAPLDPDARLVRQASWRVATTITVAVSALVVAVLIAALFVVFTQVSPVDLFGPNRQETIVDVGGRDILGWGLVIGAIAIALAATLSILVTRRAVAPLVDALRRQRRFVADASHELRTPLAIVDARIQMLDRALAPDDQHRELVAELRADSRALTGVVSDLLDAIDVPPAGPVAPVPVERVVGSAVSAMRALGEERGVPVALAPIPPGLTVAVPEASLHRSLVALLDNAVKHSPAGRPVQVAVTSTRSEVRIDVADQGGGIRGISPERVFDRFARSADAVDGGGSGRTGFGIGLALVQDTVSRYGGSAAVTATSTAGTTMTLRFPLGAGSRSR